MTLSSSHISELSRATNDGEGHIMKAMKEASLLVPKQIFSQQTSSFFLSYVTIFRFSPSRTILMLLYKMCAGWGQEKMSLSDFSANIHNLFSKSKYNKLRRGLSATERIIKIQAEFYQNFGISFTDGRFRIWIERSAESFTIFSLFFQLFSDDIAWSHQLSLLFGLSVELAGSLCSSLRVTSSRAGEKFKNSLFCCYRIQAPSTHNSERSF